MKSLTPLECLRFFECAARHESFAGAARELGVTSAAVAHRVKTFEEHVGYKLFDRSRRGVSLNSKGGSCLGDAQRILAQIENVIERHRNEPPRRRVSIVARESIVHRWLMPRLVDFNGSHPDIAVELETDRAPVDSTGGGFDIWITYSGAVGAPSVKTARHQALFEDSMFPVCSPALLQRLGRPQRMANLRAWPLLYHLGWSVDWTHWFANRGEAPPDLSRASSFSVYSMMVQAAIDGVGATIGHRTAIACELEQGTLVPVLEGNVETRASCCLIIASAAEQRPEVRTFRNWIVEAAADDRSPGFPGTG